MIYIDIIAMSTRTYGKFRPHYRDFLFSYTHASVIKKLVSTLNPQRDPKVTGQIPVIQSIASKISV